MRAHDGGAGAEARVPSEGREDMGMAAVMVQAAVSVGGAETRGEMAWERGQGEQAGSSAQHAQIGMRHNDTAVVLYEGASMGMRVRDMGEEQESSGGGKRRCRRRKSSR